MVNKNGLNETWNHIISTLQVRLNSPSIETWLKAMKPIAFIDDSLIIEVPDKFTKDWLADRYGPIIRSILYDFLEEELNVEFILHQDLPARILNKNKKSSALSEDTLPHLNAKYTFDNFVVGNNNRFAHAASLAVAESPAKSYNPLFIYGGVGLGKTHLMHAIGNHIISRSSMFKVLYITSEKFTNELINSIRDDKTVEFRNKYRNVDILLIDDIQFLAGKERTQEEFFHTFNTLYEANKQIIISSDRPPKDIPTLEDRLRSRFEWGLITDIQTPDFETRTAILRKKAQLENLDVHDDILTYIAGKIQSNIRELEGALIRLIAYASFNKQEVSLQLAEKVLKDILPETKPRQITVGLIQQVVSDYFNIRPEDLKAKKRSRNVSFPRQIAMYLTREMTDLSLPKIGESYGGRDHTTVIHACERISSEMELDHSLRTTIEDLIHRIRND
ncbi:MAG: chromosomal replication initiator protein DnaA [Peptococcaceae bacterium]|nr:chromosomal replication initiator protein DnaA [Peptococcaceae bacterium]